MVEFYLSLFLVDSLRDRRSTPTPLDIMATTTAPPHESPVEEIEETPPGWGEDDAISFSKESGKYLRQNDDGSEMEWNPKLRVWLPVVNSP